MKKSVTCLLVISFLPLIPASLYGRKRSSRSDQIQQVQLPADYAIDMQLAFAGRSAMLGGSPPIVGTPLNQVGQEVFDGLVRNTFISSYALPYQWNLTLVGNKVLNAASTAGGQVYVNGGLAELMGSDRGLWAAALSHEIAHTALRHQVRTYLQRLYIAQQIQYFRWRAANGDKSANWALLGFSIAAPMALRKLEREQEHQADIQGMMLMARAGYHPDYVFALHHMLQMTTGEQSKFAAFFSDHPRWATRDQRSDRAYADALAQYKQLWGDPASSLGGIPPSVAFLGEPHALENKRTKTADMTIPLYCRNTSDPVTLVIQFSRDRREVPAALPEFRSPSGNLELRQSVQCPDQEDAKPIEVHMPANAMAGRDRKLKALTIVVGPRNSVLEVSKVFDVRIPKP
jgi:hypothetical protein